jgi:hypothetical protein
MPFPLCGGMCRRLIYVKKGENFWFSLKKVPKTFGW